MDDMGFATIRLEPDAEQVYSIQPCGRPEQA